AKAESCNALSRPMVETLKTVLGTLLLLFQSRSRLQVEIIVLRHQLIVLRGAEAHPTTNGGSAAVRGALRLCAGVFESIGVINPETIARWHRRGFSALWQGKSRQRVGSHRIPRDVRDLIRQFRR